jgi:hypothetical protein
MAIRDGDDGRLDMNIYLSADELAELIGCRPNSYACMRRYLTKYGWPFAQNLRGFPIVSRAYHDARLSGALPHIDDVTPRVAPNFAALVKVPRLKKA